jgi:TusA-related sulfurtransferase
MGMESRRNDLLVTVARHVQSLRPGELLKVVTDDPAAREELSAWCRMTGNELAGVVKGKGYASYFVRRAS